MIKRTDTEIEFKTVEEAVEYECEHFRYSMKIDGERVWCRHAAEVFSLVKALKSREIFEDPDCRIEMPNGMVVGVRDREDVEEMVIALHNAMATSECYRIVRIDGVSLDNVGVLYTSLAEARLSAERSYHEEPESQGPEGVWAWLTIETLAVLPIEVEAAAE